MSANLPTMQVVAVLVVRFVRKMRSKITAIDARKCLMRTQEAIEQQLAVAATTRSTSEIGYYANHVGCPEFSALQSGLCAGC